MKNNWPYYVGILFASLLIAWHVTYYFKLVKKEKDIIKLKNEIDTLEPDFLDKIRGSLSGQEYLDRLVAKKEKPLRAKLERLQMERQFILDKLPIIGFFKR